MSMESVEDSSSFSCLLVVCMNFVFSAPALADRPRPRAARCSTARPAVRPHPDPTRSACVRHSVGRRQTGRQCGGLRRPAGRLARRLHLARRLSAASIHRRDILLREICHTTHHAQGADEAGWARASGEGRCAHGPFSGGMPPAKMTWPKKPWTRYVRCSYRANLGKVSTSALGARTKRGCEVGERVGERKAWREGGVWTHLRPMGSMGDRPMSELSCGVILKCPPSGGPFAPHPMRARSQTTRGRHGRRARTRGRSGVRQK